MCARSGYMLCPVVGLAARLFAHKRSEGWSGWPSRASCTEGEPWGSIAKPLSLSTKTKHAVAIADGRRGRDCAVGRRR